MTDEGVLRLLTFRPVGSGAAFDAAFREHVLPKLVAAPGIVDVYVGRHGPDESGERAIASVWASRASADAGGARSVVARFHPPLADEMADERVDILPLAIAFRFERAASPQILRIFRGRVREEELDIYVEEARSGTLEDAQRNGPTALYLALARPDRFITVSVWAGWSDIEAATGGNIRRPIATRNAGRLLEAQATHYEILPHG